MTMLKVYVRYKEDLPESEMIFVAMEGFRLRGVETVPFYGFGDIEKIEDFGPDVGIVGYIGDVWDALKTLGIPKPEPLDYPDELEWCLGRWIKRSTISNVRNDVFPGVFVKPVDHKIFTGFVMTGGFDDAIRLAPYDPDEPVWLSQAVDFVSEYRVFILDRQVLDVRRYKGDWSVTPNKIIINDAVAVWESQPVAWTLDIGVTNGGETLLVEVNDGYSFGGYGLLSTSYARMIEARWNQLVYQR